MVFEESSVKKKIVVLILVGSLFTVASGAFLYFKQSLPIVKKSMIHSKSIHDYAASPPERSYCEEAKEAMEEISKYPLMNGYEYKPYVVHFSKAIEDTNYSGPDYLYIIKSKKNGKLIVSMINMENRIRATDKEKNLIRCNASLPEEIFTWFGRHSNNILRLGENQCLIYKTKDIKENYPIYLTVEKCLVTEYKGDLKDNELKEKYPHE